MRRVGIPGRHGCRAMGSQAILARWRFWSSRGELSRDFVCLCPRPRDRWDCPKCTPLRGRGRGEGEQLGPSPGPSPALSPTQRHQNQNVLGERSRLLTDSDETHTLRSGWLTYLFGPAIFPHATDSFGHPQYRGRLLQRPTRRAPKEWRPSRSSPRAATSGAASR